MSIFCFKRARLKKKKKIRPGGSAAKINELFSSKKNPQALLPSQQIRAAGTSRQLGCRFSDCYYRAATTECVLLNNNT